MMVQGENKQCEINTNSIQIINSTNPLAPQFLIIIQIQTNMPTKFSIKSAKGMHYFTAILDPYFSGSMEEVNCHNVADEIKTKVYKIYHESSVYILKMLSCPKDLKDILDQTRNEYQLVQKLSWQNSHIAQALDKQEWEDPESDEVHIEMLFEYGGEPLSKYYKKLTVKDLMSIIRKTLAPLALLEANGVFHSDIKPQNIVIKDGDVKIIDFGVSKDLKEKTMLFKTFHTFSTKIIGGTSVFLPPEIIRRTGNYVLGKFDVYCWGMTIYQLITGKSIEEMTKEVEMFKETGKDYAGFVKVLKGIKLEGDTEGHYTKMIIYVLKKVLDLVSEQRPSFTILKDFFGEENDSTVKMKMPEQVVACKEKLKEHEEEEKLLKEEMKVSNDNFMKFQLEHDKVVAECERTKITLEQCQKGLNELQKNYAKANEELVYYKTKCEAMEAKAKDASKRCRSCGIRDFYCNPSHIPGWNHAHGKNPYKYTCNFCGYQWDLQLQSTLLLSDYYLTKHNSLFIYFHYWWVFLFLNIMQPLLSQYCIRTRIPSQTLSPISNHAIYSNEFLQNYFLHLQNMLNSNRKF
eukprot:TRINITY_DN124374_c0_g1_i1.p1 TRINITY_DN124374_c0_g1~~TRINITY_DN124374_c0_g1_i1.p1  ORF type:complete len:574 (+),score=49.06 TRINITY_DN124374_c0_g1_i1:228-1949(+)